MRATGTTELPYTPSCGGNQITRSPALTTLHYLFVLCNYSVATAGYVASNLSAMSGKLMERSSLHSVAV